MFSPHPQWLAHLRSSRVSPNPLHPVLRADLPLSTSVPHCTTVPPPVLPSRTPHRKRSTGGPAKSTALPLNMPPFPSCPPSRSPMLTALPLVHLLHCRHRKRSIRYRRLNLYSGNVLNPMPFNRPDPSARPTDHDLVPALPARAHSSCPPSLCRLFTRLSCLPIRPARPRPSLPFLVHPAHPCAPSRTVNLTQISALVHLPRTRGEERSNSEKRRMDGQCRTSRRGRSDIRICLP